jgi:hypothetical protein
MFIKSLFIRFMILQHIFFYMVFLDFKNRNNIVKENFKIIEIRKEFNEVNSQIQFIVIKYHFNFLFSKI